MFLWYVTASDKEAESEDEATKSEPPMSKVAKVTRPQGRLLHLSLLFITPLAVLCCIVFECFLSLCSVLLGINVERRRSLSILTLPKILKEYL